MGLLHNSMDSLKMSKNEEYMTFYYSYLVACVFFVKLSVIF